MGLGLGMNHNKTISKILVCLGVIAFTSCAKSHALKPQSEFSSEAWPLTCRVLKQNLSPESLINTTFQPRPDKIAINVSWKLNWFGQQVPIPAIDYSHVLIHHSTDGYNLILIDDSKTVFILLSQNHNDVFTQFLSEEESTLLKTKVGELVSLGKIVNFGYRHTLDDLTCTDTRVEQESPIAIALILKSLDSPWETVYDLNSGVGALKYNQGEAEEKWQLKVDDGNNDLDMYFKLPKEHPYGDLGLFIGRDDWQTAQGIPLWLTHLETALAHPTRNNWQALQTALKTANMSSKSIQELQKLIDESSD